MSYADDYETGFPDDEDYDYPDHTAARDSAIRWAREVLATDFVILDSETTGLDEDDEAVSIGLVTKSGEVLIDTLLCHEKTCTPKALATHGVSWEQTRQAPHFREVAPKFFETVAGKNVLGYNTTFDLRIIKQTLTRYGLANSEHPGPVTVGDVMQAFAEFYGEWTEWSGSYRWKKLTFAAEYFGLSTEGAHGASADCLMTLKVLKAMAESKLSNEKE